MMWRSETQGLHSSRWYVLAVMTATYMLSFLDRHIINILAEPIRKDLNLLDWQIGVLSGLAFALLYSTASLPIARYADHAPRPAVIAVSLSVWSAFTSLCGVATGFAQLCLFRMGVGLGEAGGTPAAHALLTDYFPKARRGLAFGVFSMGVPIGSLLGMALGGLIADRYGWRAAFLVAGLPGIALAAATLVTVKEVRRAAVGGPRAGAALKPSRFWVEISRQPGYWLIVGAATLKASVAYGQAPFVASFFLRVHGEEVARLAAGVGLQPVGFLGVALGLILGIGGATSYFIGGWIADWAGRRGAVMHAPALAEFVILPSFTLALIVPHAGLALGLLAIPSLLAGLWAAPVYSTTQNIMPSAVRATAAALLLAIANLAGLGLGPFVTGALSDGLSAAGLGPAEGLRWALILVGLLAIPTGLTFMLAGRATRAAQVDPS